MERKFLPCIWLSRTDSGILVSAITPSSVSPKYCTAYLPATSVSPHLHDGSKLSLLQELRACFREQTLLNLQLKRAVGSGLLIFQCTTFYLSTGTFNVNFAANIHIFKPLGGFRVQATQNGYRDFLYLFISLGTEA